MSRSEPLQLPALLPATGAPSPAVGVADVQILGQGGARRGLRLGEAALRTARSAYLAAEWSGPDDRRPEAGLLVQGRL